MPSRERKLRRFACLAFILWLPAAATAADEAPPSKPVASPALDSNALLTLRGGIAPGPQLHLIFDQERDGATREPIDVRIGPDYFDLESEDHATIYDLKLHRRFVIDRLTAHFSSFSLYGDLIFRQIELGRRLGITQSLTKAGQGKDVPAGLQPFWIEGELGLSQRSAEQIKIERSRDENGVLRFRFAGKEIATLIRDTKPVPAALRHSFAAFLHDRLPIHPEIAEAIEATGFVPSQLVFTTEAKGETESVSLSLRSAEIAPGEYPLPQFLAPVLVPENGKDPDVALLRDVLPHMIDAEARRAGDGPRSVADYRRGIDAAFRHGKRFQVALLLAEMDLQLGRSATDCDTDAGDVPCHDGDEINDFLRDDPRANILFKAAALQVKKSDEAIAAWRGLDRKDVLDPYVIDMFLGRNLSLRGKRDAAGLSFRAAFAGNPYVPTLYRDLGDHYARVVRIDLAWLCYDLGRNLPGRQLPDALSDIDQLEQELTKQYPDYL